MIGEGAMARDEGATAETGMKQNAGAEPVK